MSDCVGSYSDHFVRVLCFRLCSGKSGRERECGHLPGPTGRPGTWLVILMTLGSLLAYHVLIMNFYLGNRNSTLLAKTKWERTSRSSTPSCAPAASLISVQVSWVLHVFTPWASRPSILTFSCSLSCSFPGIPEDVWTWHWEEHLQGDVG